MKCDTSSFCALTFYRSNNSGDSYTSTGYAVDGDHPTETNPLGNPPYPGETYSVGPNWVGYLAKEYSHSPILVHNFAVGGADVFLVRRQVENKFLPHAGKKPSWAPWTSNNALFCLYMCDSN
jgi:hypothetical protein